MDNKRKASDFSASSSSSLSSNLDNNDTNNKFKPIRSRSRSRDEPKNKNNKRKNSSSPVKNDKHSNKISKNTSSSMKKENKTEPSVDPVILRQRNDVLRGKDEISLFLDQYKRLTIRKFKGKTLIDIREFYSSDGEMKPGKKGIALSLDCWKKITENVDFINESINEIK